jgi:hypothetical protein
MVKTEPPNPVKLHLSRIYPSLPSYLPFVFAHPIVLPGLRDRFDTGLISLTLGIMRILSTFVLEQANN